MARISASRASKVPCPGRRRAIRRRCGRCCSGRSAPMRLSLRTAARKRDWLASSAVWRAAMAPRAPGPARPDHRAEQGGDRGDMRLRLGHHGALGVRRPLRATGLRQVGQGGDAARPARRSASGTEPPPSAPRPSARLRRSGRAARRSGPRRRRAARRGGLGQDFGVVLQRGEGGVEHPAGGLGGAGRGAVKREGSSPRAPPDGAPGGEGDGLLLGGRLRSKPSMRAIRPSSASSALSSAAAKRGPCLPPRAFRGRRQPPAQPARSGGKRQQDGAAARGGRHAAFLRHVAAVNRRAPWRARRRPSAGRAAPASRGAGSCSARRTARGPGRGGSR